MVCRARGDDKLSFSGKHVWLSNTGELCACTCVRCIPHSYITTSRMCQEDPATILLTARQTSRLLPVASCTATHPLSYVLLPDKPKGSNLFLCSAELAAEAQSPVHTAVSQQPAQVQSPAVLTDAAPEQLRTRKKRHRSSVADENSTKSHLNLGSEQPKAAEKADLHSSATGRLAAGPKRRKTAPTATADENKQAQPAPALVQNGKKRKRSKIVPNQQAQMSNASPQPQAAQQAAPASSAPVSPEKGKKRRKADRPDAGPAEHQPEQTPKHADRSEHDRVTGPNFAAVAKQSKQQPKGAKPKRRKATGSAPEPSPEAPAKAKAAASPRKAGGASSLPELPSGMSWKDSGKRTDVKKGRRVPTCLLFVGTRSAVQPDSHEQPDAPYCALPASAS